MAWYLEIRGTITPYAVQVATSPSLAQFYVFMPIQLTEVPYCMIDAVWLDDSDQRGESLVPAVTESGWQQRSTFFSPPPALLARTLRSHERTIIFHL